ncbi:MAG: polysaccharide deacetylase family protein [Methylacidiphilales bacterium]|nr:polysaccharide deacetylase family protein [Candidatus Methylacidiphilales bacterium]
MKHATPQLPRQRSWFNFLAFTVLLALPACAQNENANPVVNPGFEDGANGWLIKDSMSTVVPEAAHEGKMGLRISDQDPKGGSSVFSSKLAVTPATALKLSFWEKSDKPGFLGVYLYFYTESGQLINDPLQRAGAGHPVCGAKDGDGQWHQFTLNAAAPDGAASVALWIHSFGGSVGIADVDDFSLEGAGARLASQESAPVAMAAVPAAAPVDLPPRKAPPKIIIKVDDLRQVDGKVNGLWIKFAEFIKSRKIKANIGIICETLETTTPEYTQWIKDQQATGLFEFWFHAWDHNTHLENGEQFNEFNNRPYEEQRKRFERSQQLAVEKLGFPFHTFGPPGGVATPCFDANTIRVMDEDPNMKVWLYPVPLDEPGKQLAAKGKVVILDRVWEVNIESKVGLPDFDKFVAGYAKHPEREYFVIQGHPMHWAPDRFDNFVKIIDFLTEQKAEFVLASEYAAHPAGQ